MAHSETEWGQLLRSIDELTARLARDFLVFAARRPGRQLIVTDEMVEHLKDIWKRSMLESARLGAIYQREKSKRVAAAREAPARQRREVKEMRIEENWLEDATTQPYPRKTP